MTRMEKAIVAALAGTCVLVGALLLEERVLSSPARATVVTILRVEPPQQTEGTPVYRYQCQLPDGSTAGFKSGRMYPAGIRVNASVSQGWVTRIVRLRDPSSPVAPAPPEAPSP
jgi:hypothetical protein